jgi:hypothetical protein
MRSVAAMELKYLVNNIILALMLGFYPIQNFVYLLFKDSS